MNDNIRTLTLPETFEQLFAGEYFRCLLVNFMVLRSINPPDTDRDNDLMVFERVEQLLGRVSGHATTESINFADALYILIGQGLLRVDAAEPRHLHDEVEGMSVELYEPTRHANCHFTSPDMSPFEVQAEPGRVHACRACQILNEQLCAELEQPDPYHDDATDAVETAKMG